MSSAHVCHCYASCFAVLSFLHVPTRMSAPLWLMMGSAFRIACPPHVTASTPPATATTTTTTATTAEHAAAPSQSPLASSTVTALFLTAKHTFLPWDWVSASVAAEMKIPHEYRKPRYVVAKLYASDAVTRRSDATTALPVQLAAVHPTLDVALLVLRTPRSTSSDCIGSKDTTKKNNDKDKDSKQCATAAAAADIVTGARPLCMWHDDGGGDAAVQSSCDSAAAAAAAGGRGVRGCIVGYRGVGALGELDTLDASLLRTLPPHERDALLREMASGVEGKQARHAVDVQLTSTTRGVCRLVHASERCYHGMSGAPLLIRRRCTRQDKCQEQHRVDGSVAHDGNGSHDDGCGCCAYAGVLYGMHTEERDCVGVTPAAQFRDWLHDAVARVCST